MEDIILCLTVCFSARIMLFYLEYLAKYGKKKRKGEPILAHLFGATY